MKYIPKWLTERLPWLKKTVEDDLPSNPESDDPEDTIPNLKVLDPDSSDTDKSTGSDPDDTVNMHKE